MLETFLASLEGSPAALMLRSSLWVYPAVNTGHIIGIALLFGSIVPLDLKLIGLWPKTPLAPLLRVLSTTAAFGVALTIVCGVLLFITRSSSYLGSTLFIVKMILVGAGLLNGLILRIVLSPHRSPQWVIDCSVPLAVRIAACFSFLLWTSALILGRLIGYVH